MKVYYLPASHLERRLGLKAGIGRAFPPPPLAEYAFCRRAADSPSWGEAWWLPQHVTQNRLFYLFPLCVAPLA